MKTCCYLGLLPCLLGPVPAPAQTSLSAGAQSTGGLAAAAGSGGDIVVTANRDARPIGEVGQAITVLDTATIERRQAAVVSDLLRQTPGVTVARNGGVGTTTTVSIRGAESDQTVALIDGVKLNDPSSPGGGFNFGPLLIGNIARIEVLRGAQSVLWGSQAIGGVVNLITRQPTGQLAINARAEGGWHDTGQAFANVSGKAGPVALSVGGGYFTSEGISTYVRGAERDGYRNYGANGSASITLTDALSVDLRGFYSNGRTDIDGFPPPAYAFGDTPEYGDSEQWIGDGGVNLALFDGRLKNRFAYARTESDRRDIDPTDGVETETFRGKGRNARLEYQGVLALGDAVRATFGAEREVSRFRTSSYGGPATRGRARIFSVYGQLAATPVAGLTLTGGLRRDDHNIFGGATTASASGVWSPNAGATTFRASYSEGFKAPTLFQLQSEYGNALLDPERSKGWDAGVTQRALDGRAEAGVTYFSRRSRDLIVFVSCGAPLTGICTGRPDGTYDNLSRATAEGVEASLTLKPVDALTVVAAFTWLDAENRQPGANLGRRLPRRPSSSTTVNVDYRWPFGLAAGATVTAVGDSFDNASNARRLDGYALVDLRASVPIGRHLEVYGRVENVFAAAYQTVFQYGQPGRAAFAGVRASF